MATRLILRQVQRQKAAQSMMGYLRHRPIEAPAVFPQLPLVNTLIPTSKGGHFRLFSSEAKRKEDVKFETEATEEGEKAVDEVEATEEGEKAVEEEEAAQTEPSKEEQLEEQVKELKNQLMRSLAEAENTRKIASRDVDSAKQFAIKSFAKSLLDVSDNLTRALQSVPEEARNNKDNTVLTTLYEGIEMTDKGLLKAFEMNGLVKYGEVGEKFDPNIHDALFEYVDEEKEVGTIGNVMKPGFLLHKRVLRPAEVGVIKKE